MANCSPHQGRKWKALAATPPFKLCKCIIRGVPHRGWSKDYWTWISKPWLEGGSRAQHHRLGETRGAWKNLPGIVTELKALRPAFHVDSSRSRSGR